MTGQVLPTAEIPPDAAIGIRNRHPSDEADLVIGEALADMVVGDYAQETPLGNLTVDLIRGHAGSDLALLRCAGVGNVLQAHVVATGSIHPRCDGRLIIEGALPRARPRT